MSHIRFTEMRSVDDLPPDTIFLKGGDIVAISPATLGYWEWRECLHAAEWAAGPGWYTWDVYHSPTSGSYAAMTQLTRDQARRILLMKGHENDLTVPLGL